MVMAGANRKNEISARALPTSLLAYIGAPDNRRPMKSPRGVWLWAIGALWLALVLGGMLALGRYKSTAGEVAHAPAAWPKGTTLPRAAGRPTLLMFAHPFCPCTRASMAELARLMTKANGALDAHVVFVRPDGASGTWEDTELWDSARAIPGVTAHLDANAQEAERFASLTSGQVLLYSVNGELQFEGGITPARGHEGDNAGVERVLALAGGADAGLTDTPVFGCPLHDPVPNDR
jgi:hypothetical protein